MEFGVRQRGPRLDTGMRSGTLDSRGHGRPAAPHRMKRVGGFQAALCGLLGAVWLSSPAAFAQGTLPKGTVSVPITDISDLFFAIGVVDDFCCDGKYLRVNTKHPQYTSPDKKVEMFTADFPSAGDYTVWARSRRLRLGIAGPLLKLRELKTYSRDWAWHSLGRYGLKSMGATFSVFALPLGGKWEENHGLDSVLLIPDPEYTPSGAYFGIQGVDGVIAAGADPGPRPDPASRTAPAGLENTVLQTQVSVHTGGGEGRIGKYVASALIYAWGVQDTRRGTQEPHSEEHHLLMKEFLTDNLATLILGPASKKPNDKGEWWDFDGIDRAVSNCKERYGAEDVMFLVTGQPIRSPIGFDRNEDQPPTPEQREHARGILMQLVSRYGRPGPRFVKYWTPLDEGVSTGYWAKNPGVAAGYLAYLVRAMKEVNPDLVVGMWRRCWPSSQLSAEFLRQSEHLDMVSWNLFVCGRADTPLPELFKRTATLGNHVTASRELSREIRGRELPVDLVYGMNYRYWDPPDLRFARPVGGVWQALALSRVASAQAFIASCYSLWLMTGPPDRVGGEFTHARPNLRVLLFFKKHLARASLNRVDIGGDREDFCFLSASKGQGAESMVAVNCAARPRLVTVELHPAARAAAYTGFEWPAAYVYCDRHTAREGKGVFFNAKGRTELTLPPYSALCLSTALAHPVFDPHTGRIEVSGTIAPCRGLPAVHWLSQNLSGTDVRADVDKTVHTVTCVLDAAAGYDTAHPADDKDPDTFAFPLLPDNSTYGKGYVILENQEDIRKRREVVDSPPSTSRQVHVNPETGAIRFPKGHAPDGKLEVRVVGKTALTYSRKERAAELSVDLVINGALILGTLDGSYQPANYANDRPSGTPDEVLKVADGRRIVNRGKLVVNESLLSCRDDGEPFHFASGGREFRFERAKLHGVGSPIRYEHGSMKVALVDSEISGFNCVVSDPWASYSSASLDVRGCRVHDGGTAFYLYHSAAQKVFEDNVLRNVKQTFRVIASKVAATNTSMIGNQLSEGGVLTRSQWLTVERGTSRVDEIGIKIIDCTGVVQVDKKVRFSQDGRVRLAVMTARHDAKAQTPITRLSPVSVVLTGAGKRQELRLDLDGPESVALE